MRKNVDLEMVVGVRGRGSHEIQWCVFWDAMDLALFSINTVLEIGKSLGCGIGYHSVLD